MKVFVYGTLKSGYGNNRILQGTDKICDAVVQGFKLFMSGFPVATSCHQSSISGEIWDIGDPLVSESSRSVLQRLDALEGVPYMYTRENASAVDSEGNRHHVEFYVGNYRTWREFSGMEECPKDENNLYTWSRERYG